MSLKIKDSKPINELIQENHKHIHTIK